MCAKCVPSREGMVGTTISLRFLLKVDWTNIPLAREKAVMVLGTTDAFHDLDYPVTPWNGPQLHLYDVLSSQFRLCTFGRNIEETVL